MRFLFTCGGTAGHINPALAVAGTLKKALPESEFLFVGTDDRMEAELIPREGYDFRAVKITGLSRGFSPQTLKRNAATLKNVLLATSAAKKILREFKPDAALGTGGYVCYPVLRAARALGVPFAVHESNAVPGLTTKLLSGFADKILVGFEESRGYYKTPGRVEVTGTPVRADFTKHSQAEAKKLLGLPPGKPLVLSMWGSIGADYMNGLFMKLIGLIYDDPAFALIHSTGRRNYEISAETLKACGLTDLEKRGIYVRDYIYDAPAAMTAADLVVCRAGASTLAELAVSAKPSVLVPSPNVTNNHQERNARVLERAGAARVLSERNLTAETLLKTITTLIGDKAAFRNMSDSVKRTGRGDAASKISGILLDLAAK